jgi:hypothetical protein
MDGSGSSKGSGSGADNKTTDREKSLFHLTELALGV